jgi:uncharacterized protein YdhG (YjbR/CyaY superfamily)
MTICLEPAMANVAFIQSYLADCGGDQRAALERLPQAIREALPDAVECTHDGLSAFCWLERPLVTYERSKNDCALYPLSPPIVQGLADELESFATSKGAIRFRPGLRCPTTWFEGSWTHGSAKLAPNRCPPDQVHASDRQGG